MCIAPAKSQPWAGDSCQRGEKGGWMHLFVEMPSLLREERSGGWGNKQIRECSVRSSVLFLITLANIAELEIKENAWQFWHFTTLADLQSQLERTTNLGVKSCCKEKFYLYIWFLFLNIERLGTHCTFTQLCLAITKQLNGQEFP